MADDPRTHLVLGGARSGKSRYAEEVIRARPAPWIYVATAEAMDAEMETRIARHRAERGAGWETCEAPLDLAGALARAPAGAAVLVDCLTLWLTNVLLAERDVPAEIDRLVALVAGETRPLVLVANEVGLGIVPDNALARAFRDHAGILNQRLAAVVDRVVFTVAGVPMVVK
ncbi:bifunctional adenosylcobinamide kinase/adenosylcobinamide-phosphate guanylyltransferase [Chelatococcus sp. SYSU_G07232]|uniref:Bifunctional adenosylcobalamin biosynthesis protein n=1 Tax=Chelatococcus albus TaxID=3047466 RepID=A0ABT7AHF1_9HYPH|nr:bifunctional adenosylcobinamide kinase/adenosylcobinamide-phosphate guanylyltransferase [Chelatococcus sp. SYSU_G07232]MDJ1158794.1 bifunctional adenosylcobinamide kinase/adenosylcobinamide-phosphate guanylyltransferase [Chelatococcus sp. SYSU_G07232]